jgi:hypothetical protein
LARATIGPAGATTPSAGHHNRNTDRTAGLAGVALGEVLTRAGDPAEYERWAEQARMAGYCARPVRLAGGADQVDTTTGEIHETYTTEREPDGVLLKACGTRRAARCQPCAEVYRRDAFQLVAAGLRGGKGIPGSVAEHPCLFVTFTAPSFGPVHSRREHGGRVRPCHPRNPEARCSHGRPAGCRRRHREDDPEVGAPICADCFDYQAAVLWNATAPELWRRTTIYLRRALGRLAGLSRAELDRRVRLSHVKVAEYQRRGLVHYHAIIRLDGRAPGQAEAVVPPPSGFTVELLAAAVRATAATVTAPLPPGASDRAARWGGQLDIRAIHTAELPAEQVAGYLAKYATKATESFGTALVWPIRGMAELASLDVPEHVARLVRACWQLGARPDLAALELRRFAHMLGYRGHWSTKSRRYSTTMRDLRAARRAWATRRRHGPGVPLDRDGRPLPPEGTVTIGAWEYTGSGYTTLGDAWLAASMATQAHDQRRIAREEVGTDAP